MTPRSGKPHLPMLLLNRKNGQPVALWVITAYQEQITGV